MLVTTKREKKSFILLTAGAAKAAVPVLRQLELKPTVVYPLATSLSSCIYIRGPQALHTLFAYAIHSINSQFHLVRARSSPRSSKIVVAGHQLYTANAAFHYMSKIPNRLPEYLLAYPAY